MPDSMKVECKEKSAKLKLERRLGYSLLSNRYSIVGSTIHTTSHEEQGWRNISALLLETRPEYISSAV